MRERVAGSVLLPTDGSVPSTPVGVPAGVVVPVMVVVLGMAPIPGVLPIGVTVVLLGTVPSEVPGEPGTVPGTAVPGMPEVAGVPGTPGVPGTVT